MKFVVVSSAHNFYLYYNYIFMLITQSRRVTYWWRRRGVLEIDGDRLIGQWPLLSAGGIGIG